MAVELQKPLTDIGHLSPLNQARYTQARLSYDEYLLAYTEHFQQVQTMSRETLFLQPFDTFVKIEDLELFYNVVSAWKPAHGPCPTLAGMLVDAQWPDGVEYDSLMKFRDRLEQHIKRSAFTMPEPVAPKISEDPVAKAEYAAKLNRDRVARHRATQRGIDVNNPVEVALAKAVSDAQANLKAGQTWRKQRLSELQEAKRAAKAKADIDYHNAMVNINWHVAQAEKQVVEARAAFDAHNIAKQ